MKKKIIKTIDSMYKRKANQLGVSIEYTTKNIGGSAMYDYSDRTIIVNVSRHSLGKNTDSDFVVIMAHELGHAHDHIINGNKPSIFTYMKAIISKSYQGKYILRSEYTAYQYGLLYVPSTYKARYIAKNESYLADLEVNPLMMHGG